MMQKHGRISISTSPNMVESFHVFLKLSFALSIAGSSAKLLLLFDFVNAFCSAINSLARTNVVLMSVLVSFCTIQSFHFLTIHLLLVS